MFVSSCCHHVDDGCGRDKLARVDRFDLGIWKDGCVEVLRHKMRTEVQTLLMVYTFLGALLAIVELITVVLACAYVAQINRRDRKQQQDHQDYLPALSSKETKFDN